MGVGDGGKCGGKAFVFFVEWDAEVWLLVAELFEEGVDFWVEEVDRVQLDIEEWILSGEEGREEFEREGRKEEDIGSDEGERESREDWHRDLPEGFVVGLPLVGRIGEGAWLFGACMWVLPWLVRLRGGEQDTWRTEH